MKLLRLLIPVSPVMLFVTAGFSQDVRYNYARDADFSSYHTYSWVQITDTPQVGQLANQQLKSTIDAELSRKGLAKVDSNPDLLIAYQTAVNQEKQFTSYTSGFGPGWGYGPGWGGWGYGGFNSATTMGQTSTIHIGALGLDIYDAKKHDLVWRGEATKTLDPKAKPEKVQKNLNKTVAKLLKNYPPPGSRKPAAG